MSLKSLTTILFLLALIAASIFGIVYFNSKADIATAQEQKAQLELDKAESLAKKAAAEQEVANKYEMAEKSKAKAAEENRKANELKVESESLALERAKSEEATACAAAEEAKAREKESAQKAAALDAEATKASAAKVVAQEAAAKAKAEAKKAEAERQSAADKLEAEKVKAEIVLAEAKIYELKKVDFEKLHHDLMELQQELEERERALTPDKTSADLAWVGEREADVIGVETNVVRSVRKKVLPEDDVRLPRGERTLQKANRLVNESTADLAAKTKAEVVAKLEALWLKAKSENRVVDAEYYFKSLKTLYPDWEYNPKKEVEEK